MYAIIKTGGKQYRVQQGDEFKVEKLNANVGDTVVFDEVIAVGGDKLVAGTPFVKGYAVTAEVLEHGKNDKVIIFKYKAKKDYRRKNGHRQPYTLVKITDISESGVSSDKASAPATEASEKPEAEESKAASKVSTSMKKDELLAVAEEMGVKVNPKATKAEIIAAIEAE